jgi:ribonuclease HI
VAETLILYVDGASRGNPGPAAIGVTIRDENRQMIATISARIGETTNNRAEYAALIAGLKKAISLGAKRITVNSDSELLVKQIQGLYRIKNPGLRPLYSEAVQLVYTLASFKIESIPRELNREADRLANMALDGF